ncbi:alpha-glucan family phosphorylase [Kushneria phosphatilytica]|nr:alpha-glucan family phosphorylase [Kushneria phosphatilytica]
MTSPYELPGADIDGFEDLVELALDLSGTWKHATDRIWRELDGTLWELTHNPWAVLQTVSRERLARVLAEPAFRDRLKALIRAGREQSGVASWFEQRYPQAPFTSVAYFSMEFMVSEALPIYSGGLGNVAGDQLKAASDLGVPLIGIGLLYQQGYFRQLIDGKGYQQALYPYNDPGQLPITPLRTPDGEWLRLEIVLPGYSVWLRAWQARIGRVTLYLLDSNDVANYPAHRGITSELYGGNAELRLKQEMVLGIGGWRLLEALDLHPQVCHLNEGHAALVVLERARSYMQRADTDFKTALTVTRAGNLFTTHTAVAAGFDRFSPALVTQYLKRYAEQQLKITLDELLALGRSRPACQDEPFNMAWLACRGCGFVNGVSQLHARVSRHIFAPLFPRWPTPELPIGHVTNGVHMPSWDSAPADELWTRACGKARWLGCDESLTRSIRNIDDEALWRFRTEASRVLIEQLRHRLARQRATSGASLQEIEDARQLFDPSIMTLGFARRFATYKRPNLLLHDPQRLKALLTHSERPLQLVLAGKAHPADTAGQALIQQWVEFIREADVGHRVVFLSDYNMQLTEQLVQGVDVWLNTPRRPWEACGTSGMKVLVNGGLNISELDGWWAEAYRPEVGWALGDGREHGEDPAYDAHEADALYELFEQEVLPAFYTRDQANIPLGWVARMRESMARLTPEYSTNRSLPEYVARYYLPAAEAWGARSADNGALGQEIVTRRQRLDQHWSDVAFESVSVDSGDHQHWFRARVKMGELLPGELLVELYADASRGDSGVCQPMSCSVQPTRHNNVAVYETRLASCRPAGDFTVRLRPSPDGLLGILEEPRILWQH